jgi:hypothetical protein
VSDRRLEPPGGEPPPASVSLDAGQQISLGPLAEEVCRRYRVEFPDEHERYGDAGHAWCVHDNQYLLYWAAEALDGHLEMTREVAWLASVLEARDFPLERLARNLEIASDVVQEQLPAGTAQGLAEVLTDAAAYMRSRDTFLG